MFELSKTEIEALLHWYDCTNELEGTHQDDDDLRLRLREELERQEELESIDLNDCAGGACKL